MARTRRIGTKQALALGGRLTQLLPADLSRQTAQDWMDAPDEAVKKFLEGLHDGPAVFLKGPTITLTNTSTPLTPPGEKWHLVEDATEPTGIIQLGLTEFLEGNEKRVNGEVMLRRARKKHRPLLGERHAKALLKHQERIPKEWRGHNLVFPGTVWRIPDEELFVPCLYWAGNGWGLDRRWLAYRFDWNGRLVVPRAA